MATSISIGSLTVESNLFLAPLAGFTTLPFRLVLRALGGLGLATTDLVNARSLIEQRTAALKLIETRPADQPLAVQLFGAVPEEMRDAALLVESRGIGEAVKIPVTAKMRLGWDSQNLTAPDLARALEDVGVAAITVHGRTRDQGFGGTVNLAGIRLVVQAVKRIPVIGNGDVVSPAAARIMLNETGCAGVTIGRGAFYDPWIFAHTHSFLRTGELTPDPGFEARVRLMERHLDWMIEVFGEVAGCRQFRKIAPWYARRFGPAIEFKRRIATLASRTEFQEILAHYREWRRPFLDDRGELKPNYQPAAMVASFMQTTPASKTDMLPTPQGPVEFW